MKNTILYVIIAILLTIICMQTFRKPEVKIIEKPVEKQVVVERVVTQPVHEGRYRDDRADAIEFAVTMGAINQAFGRNNDYNLGVDVRNNNEVNNYNNQNGRRRNNRNYHKSDDSFF